MKSPNPCSEAEWMIEAIIDDFAASMDLCDRAQFYARLHELLTERRNQLEGAFGPTGREPESPGKVH